MARACCGVTAHVATRPRGGELCRTRGRAPPSSPTRPVSHARSFAELSAARKAAYLISTARIVSPADHQGGMPHLPRVQVSRSQSPSKHDRSTGQYAADLGGGPYLLTSSNDNPLCTVSRFINLKIMKAFMR